MGRPVVPDLQWIAEAVEDEGRPDLAGVLGGEEVPRVVIEAKFEHLITLGQVQAYLKLLAGHSDPTLSALALLVPTHRRTEAQQVLDAAKPTTGIALAVLTWDEVIGALRDATVDDLELSDDVRQFEGLCETYGAKDIQPFTSDPAATWPARLKDLEVIVDRVTAQLSTDRLLPIGREKDATPDGRGYYRRYISGERGQEGTWMSVGVRQPRPGFSTPLWLRYHARTGGLGDARRRLLATDLGAQVAKRGHVYVPLHIPAGVSGAEVVRQVQDQVKRVHSEALGRPWPLNDSESERFASSTEKC